MTQEEVRDLAVSDEAELERIKAEVSGSSLYNEDLAPTGPEERTWTTYNIAAVFIGVVPVLPGFFKAATTPNFSGVFENPTFVEGLYTHGLFFTFFAAGIAYLALSVIGGKAPEVRREPEAT